SGPPPGWPPTPAVPVTCADAPCPDAPVVTDELHRSGCEHTVSAAASTSLPPLATPRAQVLLAVADDALISGHRASHWTGVAPSLEEDLAFSTIAQDGIGHA